VLVCVCGLGVVGGGLGVDGEGEVVGLEGGFVEGDIEVGVWVEEVGEDVWEVGAVAEGCAEHVVLGGLGMGMGMGMVEGDGDGGGDVGREFKGRGVVWKMFVIGMDTGYSEDGDSLWFQGDWDMKCRMESL